MRRFSIGILALAVIVLASRPGLAQRGQGRGIGGGGFGPSNLMLLSQESVQAEIKLSEDQVKKVDEQLDKQREAMAGLRDLDQQERRTKLQEQLKANDSVVGGILNEGQAKRLKQIMLQQRGAAALGDAEVAQAVGLTSEQKEKIQGIQQAALEERRAQFQGGGGGGDREEMRKKFEAARAATNEKITALLTAEQKDKWTALTGEPFKGEIRAPQRRGNRPGGAAAAPRRDPVATTSPSVFRLAAFADDKSDETGADGRDGKRDRHGRHAHSRAGARHGTAEREQGRGRHFASHGHDERHWGEHRPHGRQFAMERDHRGPHDHGDHFADRNHGRHRPDFARHHFAHHDGPRGDFARGQLGPGHHAPAYHGGGPHGHPHHHFASWRGHRDERFGPLPRRDDGRPHPPHFDRGRPQPSSGGPARRDAGALEQIAQLQRQLEVITRELASLQRELRAH